RAAPVGGGLPFPRAAPVGGGQGGKAPRMSSGRLRRPPPLFRCALPPCPPPPSLVNGPLVRGHLLGSWALGALRSGIKEEPRAKPLAGDSRGAAHPVSAGHARCRREMQLHPLSLASRQPQVASRKS